MVKINPNRILGYAAVLMCYYLMFCYFHNTVSKQLRSTVIVQFILSILCILVILIYYRKNTVNSTMATGILISFAIAMICLDDSRSNIPLINLWGKAFVWILVFIAMRMFASERIKKVIMAFTVIACLLLISMFIMSLRDYGKWVSNRDYTMTNVYYILCFMPFAVEIENKWVKRILVFLIFLCVFLSFKRSAIVVSGVIALVMILMFFKEGRKKNFALLLAFVFIAAMIILPILLERMHSQELLTMWFKRFNDSNTRSSIAADVWRMQWNSSFAQWLFGHGYNAVARDIGYGLSAHNDFLEILYDYGLLTFILFVALILRLIQYCCRLMRYGVPHAGGMIISVVLLVVTSVPSHMFTYSTYFIIIALYWGYCTALSEEIIANINTVGGPTGHEDRNPYISQSV